MRRSRSPWNPQMERDSRKSDSGRPYQTSRSRFPKSPRRGREVQFDRGDWNVRQDLDNHTRSGSFNNAYTYQTQRRSLENTRLQRASSRSYSTFENLEGLHRESQEPPFAGSNDMRRPRRTQSRSARSTRRKMEAQRDQRTFRTRGWPTEQEIFANESAPRTREFVGRESTSIDFEAKISRERRSRSPVRDLAQRTIRYQTRSPLRQDPSKREANQFPRVGYF